MQIAKIIEGALSGDKARVLAYAELLASLMDDDGEARQARIVRRAYGAEPKGPTATLDAPKQKEWGIEMDGIAQMVGLDIFDYDPGDIVRAVSKLQEFVRTSAEGFDHDEDAHKYGTYCRVCIAEELASKP
ncbi:hypothetical protein LJY25_14690 [Hymenobacter sp. BT175]|uniref:hypothetical protein n=1 Tax=Hymenobacter translucens TaxID=2886507 RepID=UPI001D0E547A|nr:hypothetical protein [Hymenobacter translucens]MCC2547700.1 hypothetical protein [Hymenobacter translucens]